MGGREAQEGGPRKRRVSLSVPSNSSGTRFSVCPPGARYLSLSGLRGEKGQDFGINNLSESNDRLSRCYLQRTAPVLPSNSNRFIFLSPLRSLLFFLQVFPFSLSLSLLPSSPSTLSPTFKITNRPIDGRVKGEEKEKRRTSRNTTGRSR